ncbi:MAG: nickel pincer cofactor biosynthesis protein LarC [Eubacteriaceae bacterium]|nr:nickel pincer cofactor biosynthesis protein LarC [Eubacteriaceae bacterium]
MRSIYIDCSMGAAGDMLMAALCELLPDKNVFVDKMNAIGIPGVHLHADSKETCGITGTHMHVHIHGVEEDEHLHDHEHHHHDHDHHHHEHSGMHDIEHLISHLNVSDKVKEDAKAVYKLIAEAECSVHGQDMEHIHFHEVGTLDAVADVAGTCLLMEMLGIEKVYASPVHVGSGTVKCAHGVLPVPAPATARILQGIPIYSEDIKGELCTPTGAALLKHFVSEFGSMPAMIVEKDGYGMGTKEFPRANCVRVMIGDTEEKADDVIEISTNLDDMTAEEIGFAMEVLMEEGALDAYCQPIIMKKGRPATRLVCMCKPDDKNRLSKLIFKHTTAIGIRINKFERIVLERSFDKAETPWGDVTVKKCMGQGTTKKKAEFEDLARIARDNDLSLREVSEKIEM